MTVERLQELLAISFKEITKENKAELIEYYKFIFSSAGCSSCKDKFSEYYQKLTANGVEKLTEILQPKENSSFKLRDNIGVVQINFSDAEYISPIYAPKELCLKFLKENPNRISMFEAFPIDWKEQIKDLKID